MLEQIILIGCLLASFWLCRNVFQKTFGLAGLEMYAISFFWVIAVACLWLLPTQLLLGQTNKIITGITTLATCLLLSNLKSKRTLYQKPKNKLVLWQIAGLFLILLPFLVNIVSNNNGWRLSIFAYNWDNGVHVLLYRSILETGKLPFANDQFRLSEAERNYPFGFHGSTAIISQSLGIDYIQEVEAKRILEISIFLVFLLFLYTTLFLCLKAIIDSDSEGKPSSVFSQIGILAIETSLFTVLFWQPVVLSAAFLAGLTALGSSLLFLKLRTDTSSLMIVTPLFIFASLAWNPLSLITIPIYVLLLYKIELNFWFKLASLALFGTATAFMSILQFFSTAIKVNSINLPGQIFTLTDLQLCLFSLVLVVTMFTFKSSAKNYFYSVYIGLAVSFSLLLFLYQIRTNGVTNYYYYKFFMTAYPVFFISSIQLVSHYMNQFGKQKIAILVSSLIFALFILETTHYQEFRSFLVGRFYMHKELYNIHLIHLNQDTTAYQATDLFDYWWGRAFMEPQRHVLKPLQ